MYWADNGLKPRIEMANLDGSGRKVLLNMTKNSNPYDITIDYEENILYW